MILVEEAVERLNRAGAPYGVRLSTWKRRTKRQQLLEAIESDLAPLALPDELRAFWSRWDPSSLQWPVFDGFIPLRHIIERRQIEQPQSPSAVMPIADWTHARIWTELSTETHAGGRVFSSSVDDGELRLWAFGISDLLDLISSAFERDLINDRTGDLHEVHFKALVKRSLDQTIGADAQRTFDGMARINFPEHWRLAEGLAPDHFALRGPTHTVQSLRSERDTADSVTATLVGTYETSIGGGPLSGCVGTFTDNTGTLQVFVPQLTGLNGAVGQGGAVEMDVIAVAPNGSDVSSLSARQELQQAVSAGRYDYSNDIVLRLMEQMKYLDTSIVVMSLRPVN